MEFHGAEIWNNLNFHSENSIIQSSLDVIGSFVGFNSYEKRIHINQNKVDLGNIILEMDVTELGSIMLGGIIRLGPFNRRTLWWS